MFETNKMLVFVFSIILIECYGDSVEPIILNIVKNSPVNMPVGPENAVYCRLLNPLLFTVFEGFERCRLIIDRMDFEYLGRYMMYSGTTDSLDLNLAILDVRITEPEEQATVTCVVRYDISNAIISCSLPESGNNVRACTFRNPRGNEILITGAQTTTNTDVGDSVRSELLDSGCAITIYNIKDPGQGIWRASIRTDADIFYGFQTVYLSSAVEDSYSIHLRPTIRPNRTLIMGIEDEPVALSCSIDAPIRYCYFRDNYSGKVINVTPDLKSSSAEYIGYGFEAGDCGLKLSGLQTSRNLEWSCNIAVVGHTGVGEYTQTLDVYIQERLLLSQHRVFGGKSMGITAYVRQGERVELCRFVRIDGFTFSTDESAWPYQAHMTLNSCFFTLNEPTELDLEPWLVAVKIRNHFEIAKLTVGLVEQPQSGASGFEIFVYVMLSAVLVCLLVVIVLGITRFRRN